MCVVEINNYLSLFMGSYVGNKICEAELNEILLHIITNGWGGVGFFTGFYCETMPFNKGINIFDRRDIVKSICEGVVEPYTHIKREDINRFNHSSKMRGRDASFKPTLIWS